METAAESIPKSFCGDLELTSTIAKGHEAQDPEDETNSFRGDIFDRTDIYSLTVVAKPISKVDLNRVSFHGEEREK